MKIDKMLYIERYRQTLCKYKLLNIKNLKASVRDYPAVLPGPNASSKSKPPRRHRYIESVRYINCRFGSAYVMER